MFARASIYSSRMGRCFLFKKNVHKQLELMTLVQDGEMGFKLIHIPVVKAFVDSLYQSPSSSAYFRLTSCTKWKSEFSRLIMIKKKHWFCVMNCTEISVFMLLEQYI